MRKNRLILISTLLIIPFVISCGGEFREALEGKKRSEQSDEFLVQKKNPLQMPPDINKLPTPGNTQIIDDQQVDKNTNVKKLLELNDNSKTDNPSNESSDLISNMLKKIQ